MSASIVNFSKSILNLPRYAKQFIAISNDIGLCIISFWLAFFLRIDEFISLQGNILIAAAVAVFLMSIIFFLTGLYRTLFRYSGKAVLISISFSMTLYSILYFSIISIYGIPGVPRSIGILQPIVLFFFISGSRLVVKYILTNFSNAKSNKATAPKTLVYGAGSAGRQLVSALDDSSEIKVIGFVDDDKLLQGQILYGLEIYSPDQIQNLIDSQEVKRILIALPSINRKRRSEIINQMNKYNLTVSSLPSVKELVEGKVTTSDIRELEIVDILGRNPVAPNLDLLKKNTFSKTIIVSGAGGSIGSELCRQLIILNPKKILLLDISEYFLYQVHTELEEMKQNLNLDHEIEIIPLLSSVNNKYRINQILKAYQPDIIYHAAAYKHVPLVEENVCEGIRNNVFGTLILTKAAIENKVPNFVLISSDKAVRPTNVMGASKRLSELCLQALNDSKFNTYTTLSMVRFGNVIGSSGSLIPKIKKQIRNGGPVTLTHPDVERYFMTIPEAAQLVIQAGSMSEGGDVFILDMGKSYKIKKLIEKMISLSGLSVRNEENPDGDIVIKTIGLRPGEKLFEELLLGNKPINTLHPKIKKANEEFLNWEILETELNILETSIKNGKLEEVLKILEKLVAEYKSGQNIFDKVFLQSENKLFGKKIVSIKKG